jgi:VCBS repeat-containing protein
MGDTAIQTHRLPRLLILIATLLLLGSWSIPAFAAGSAADVPAALRPALYQALARDAGPAYAIDKHGCAHIPAQALRGCFGADGARFAGTHAPALGLRLAAYGRGLSLQRLHAVTPDIEGNEVRYAHRALTEWWKVLPVGFEQGFTLRQRPTGQERLILALTASNSATAHGQELVWGKLRYGDLVVTDANHTVVPATLKTEHGRILIVINDTQAHYPLTVDPLVWIEQKITASDDAAGDYFGDSVAVSDSTALVGAAFATVGGNDGQGAVYVFTQSNGTWSQAQKLTANDGAASDEFGTSVALDGSIALVGALYADVNGHIQQGASYVFTQLNGTWSQAQKLTASDGAAGDLFGRSVALSGSTALVGAYGANHYKGASYVFTKSNGTWSQAQKLTASDGAAGDYFGDSVAVYGSTALVGAAYASIGNNSNQGAAYVFTQANGVWSQTQKLTASDGAAFDEFGSSVSLDASTALVGATFADIGGNNNQGAAYVFTQANGVWSQTQKLTASDGADGISFGDSVAISGSSILVGAAYAGVGGNIDQGAAYVFAQSSGVWNQVQKLAASDGADADNFGSSVALDGNTALVGAQFATIGGGHSEQGAAYIYGGNELDLAVSAPATVAPGKQYLSQAIVTNSANALTPAPVVVTLTVPAATSYVSASASQGICSETAGVVSCDFGPIAGNGGTATANVMLTATGGHGTAIQNTASTVSMPVLTAAASSVIDTPPVASSDTLTTNENTAANGTLTATDADADTLTYSLVSQAMHGSVTVNSNGSYTYTPGSGYSGSDSFAFKANDGFVDSNTATVSITVNASSSGGGSGSSSGGGAISPLTLAMLLLVGFAVLRQRWKNMMPEQREKFREHWRAQHPPPHP